MSSQKVAVVESEKSFKIFSTNWKEDLVLKRNLQVLDRSETTVVNRITVDQKIMLRRFQTKLGRSRMSYARAMGNTRLQKSLRDKTTFVLNTNIGHNEEQDDTLKKLWDKGRKSYEDRINSDSYLRKKKSRAFTCFEDETENETPRKQEIRDTRPYTACNVRPNTAVVLDFSMSPKMVSAPLARTVPEETEVRELGLLDTAVQALEAAHDDGEEKDMTNVSSDRKPRPQTARPYVEEDNEFGTETSALDVRRPSTAGGCLLSTAEEKESSRKLAQSPPARARKSARQPKPVAATNAGLGSMFQDNGFEISLVDFQRFCVHSANYEMRVKKYGDKIKPLKSANGQHVDIYTIGLRDGIAKSKKSLHMAAADEATPEDIKRATGNLTIRNLTLKNVDERHRNLNQLPPIS